MKNKVKWLLRLIGISTWSYKHGNCKVVSVTPSTITRIGEVYLVGMYCSGLVNSDNWAEKLKPQDEVRVKYKQDDETGEQISLELVITRVIGGFYVDKKGK